ncbi:hypothetical protein [Mesorhizobium sp.]|uniref:hypothetical protein n=1 Tax=Mesorhizobium sp. TaxID=1871066 RepID=UPI0012242CD0|nr:hypothetical protein [Mesorhizobium sp.]TIO79416.1 MAG: hypothetical protein E5X75_02345 [Mesorhizobium sp.]
MADQLRLAKLSLHAVMDGRFVWARLGFLPDPQYWQSVFGPGLLKLLHRAPFRHCGKFHDAVAMASSSSATALRSIAFISDLVLFDTPGEDQTICEFGPALLANGPNWNGTITVGDPPAVKLLFKGETK